MSELSEYKYGEVSISEIERTKHFPFFFKYVTEKPTVDENSDSFKFYVRIILVEHFLFSFFFF